ncbi:MAG: tetratricopeptide repeat protein [Leptolyngbyaceae cyanobacterium MO_188.B28]|nr:tetratricopeptide repeat protein [Leptolyngbyaceae cyanobacterium MO_188.B28]
MPPSDLTSSASPVSVFIAYSHKDEALWEELEVHLASLKRQGKIKAWHAGAIVAGAERDAEIKLQLETAQVILLLISHHFMASDNCYDQEMQKAVERHNAGSARVIPIIFRPCNWQGAPFSKLQALPKDAKPITKWDNQNEAFLNVIQGIQKAIQTLPIPSSPQSSPSPHPPISPSPHPPISPSPQFSTYTPQTFTGRAAEITRLTTLLSDDCRVLAILGMTGIGKTALAERVVANLMDAATGSTQTSSLLYYRFSLDDRSLTPDFSSSGAALLRTLGEEHTRADQTDPANLLTHIVTRLDSHPCRLQIDSLERLLQGDDETGWSEFCDPLWLDLLQKVMSETHFPSQLLLTSQDIPADLDTVASRYPQFWHCQTLHGLNADEQQALFQNLGLDTGDTNQDHLSRIGAFYDGHPLVLRVIAEEILQPPFQGDVARYWRRYEAEFVDAAKPKSNKLARSRQFRRRVRQRVEQSLQRLPETARQMLCASAVFRRPVSEAFWHAMLADGDAQAAFETLQDRHLVEYAPANDDQAPLQVRQHNLIRAVAYDLLKAAPESWRQAERLAAQLWLTDYEPTLNATNLETVRGYLEAFEHYYTLKDWQAAKDLPDTQLETGNPLHWQLFVWSYYPELIALQNKSLTIAREMSNRRGEGNALCVLGNTCNNLGQYEQAINHYQQYLTIAREISDRQGEGNALGNLGVAYYYLGQYEQAIDHHQQQLTIAWEVGDRQGEGKALGNLGLAHHYLGQYEQAIDLYHQQLTIVREISYRHGEGRALGNMGFAHHYLGQYEQAIDLYHQQLTIAQEISYRRGEGIALLNMGATFLKIGQYPVSLTHNRSALEIFREIGDRANEAEALKNLAELHQALGEVETARQYCRQALALALALGIPLMAECEALRRELGAGRIRSRYKN